MSVSQEQFERWLTDISDCFLNRDFDTWKHSVRLPLTLVTRSGPVELVSEPMLLANFNHYLSACAVLRLDTVLRDPLQLEDCKDGTWLGTYETRLISRGTMAVPPYVSTALLEMEAGRVKMSSVMNARGHTDGIYMPDQRPVKLSAMR